jgi:hypothetical protein
MSERVGAARKPLLERVGVRYFAARSARLAPVQAVDAVHFLNAQERSGMRRVMRGALARAAVAGALSGFLSAGSEVLAEPLLPPGASVFSAAGLAYWALLGGVTLVASALEVAFLYWDTLRSVHELSRVAGLELFGKTRAVSDEALADALARAALELPNPIHLEGRVDPHRESRRWQLLLASLVYKAKVGVTNFVVKLVVRRLLGRVAVRGLLGSLVPFVAVPVTALWNAVVMHLVLKEATIRAMGPSAVEEWVGALLGDRPQLSAEGWLAAERAVASGIVRTQDLHPNLVCLLDVVSRRAPDLGPVELDDVGAFLSSLPRLPRGELELALELLALAVIVDGRVTAREAALWRQALTRAGRPVDFSGLERMRVAFVRGDGVLHGALTRAGGS